MIFSLAALLITIGLPGNATNKIKKLDFSIQQVIQEANAGSADAQCFLGYCLINGINTKVDYYKAAEWLSKAVAQGNKPAIYYLAEIRYAIDGMDQEYKNAADCLRQLTNSAQIQSGNDNSDNFTLADDIDQREREDEDETYLSYGFEEDEFEKEMRIQATKDNPSAQYLYSMHLDDQQQRLKWLKRAAELGHASAQYKLALELSIIKNDNWISTEPIINQDVIKWLQASADQGHLPAIKSLAYRYGSDNKFHDDAKAAKYYLQAANLGDKASQLITGNYYYLGKGVTQNYAEAMKWYNTATAGEDKDSYIFSESYRHLGDCYFYGNGVQQNYNKAIEYYKKCDFYGCGYTLAKYYENNNQQTKAIEFYHQAADRLACFEGDREACDAALKLADYYYNGTHGLTQDYKQATYFYSLYMMDKLISNEEMDASAWFQKYYKAEEGQNSADDDETMFDLDIYANLNVVKQARQGNIQAQIKLGKLLMLEEDSEDEHVHFDYDLKLAATWLRKAANKGNAEAQYYLGYCLHMMQWSEEPNELVQKEIIDLYQKAARAGIVKAQLALARELENKSREDAENAFDETSYEESDEDYAVAEIDKPYAQWYLKAAQNGDAEAQYWMGEHDCDKAYYWFSKAAKQGHIDAIYDLGEYYFEGVCDVVQDSKKGIEMLTKAANAGLGDAAEKLADKYYKGEGVTRNYEKAVYWYTIAANNPPGAFLNSRYINGPSPEAQNMLGLCYRDGNGVMRDYKKAVYWFRRAAECGYSDAQKNLSECYRKGLGVPVSSSQAAWWLNLSKKFDYE